MKQFVNHIDHVAWVSHLETLEENAAQLSIISGVRFEPFEREEWGIVGYFSPKSGIEIVAPMERETEFNVKFKERLQTSGEGVWGVIMGVRNLDQEADRLAAHGFALGPVMQGDSRDPWYDKVRLSERVVGTRMNCQFVVGDIRYSDDAIDYVDVG
ncbi:hypothetical protein BSL82_11930 [Tardibacter chloracetimidivorans]|uniref:VOC domain-containing protein n=1 Tax=Tardibacter chloracetimidivorans TaxID=1921510 RepID=A0A1L3ZWC4_9SPHN|nr:hypothetical protein [Tardibacter chloracetimidivorans]API59931.1 hypothetical protein BSL82_11930 [Tardibacter chloracetimidivorans]